MWRAFPAALRPFARLPTWALVSQKSQRVATLAVGFGLLLMLVRALHGVVICEAASTSGMVSTSWCCRLVKSECSRKNALNVDCQQVTGLNDDEIRGSEVADIPVLLLGRTYVSYCKRSSSARDIHTLIS